MNFKKIRKMLVKYGVSEEEADKFISDLQAEPDDDIELEVPEGEGEPVKEESAPVDEPEAPEVQPEESDAPVDEELPVEQPAEEAAPVVEEPPVVEEQPVPEVAPVEEPAQDQDLKFEVEELKKANEGLCAKIDSLVESLKQSGVLNIVEEQSPVGVDNQSCPAEPETNDAMASFLAKANRRI